MTRSIILAAFATFALAGCSHNSNVPRDPSAPLPDIPTYIGASSVRPLATFAGQRVAVLPAQTMRLEDPMGWGAKAVAQGGESQALLAAVDTALTQALTRRGLASSWVFATDVERSAKRNPSYAPNPHSLALAQLARAERLPDEPMDDPLASQLRTLAGLNDARFLLLPLRLRFEPREVAGKTGGRAALDLVLIDARLAQLLWRGVVTSDAVADYNPSLALAAAARVPDLVVSR